MVTLPVTAGARQVSHRQNSLLQVCTHLEATHTQTHTPPLVEQRSPEQPSYTWTGTFGPTAYIKMLVCLKGRAFVVSEGRGQMTPAVGNA